jgi:hypothetical protein
MKNIVIVFLLLVFCNAHICFAQKDPVEVSQEYESCCGTQPVEFTLGKASVYVPNVFTPNGDDTNDVFMPHINKEVGEVWAFVIRSAVGDTLLFQRANINYKDLKEYAWNGTRQDGSRYKGLFNYSMQIINRDKQLRFVEGQACVIQCGPDAKVFKSKAGCYFSLQAGVNGNLDKALSNVEKDCF